MGQQLRVLGCTYTLRHRLSNTIMWQRLRTQRPAHFPTHLCQPNSKRSVVSRDFSSNSPTSPNETRTRDQSSSALCRLELPCLRFAPRRPTRTFTSTPRIYLAPANRMSDADYEAFLNKANQDTSGGEATVQAKSYGTKSVNTNVPKVLEEVQEYYVSDADEPFEPVALSFDGDSVSARKFCGSMRRIWS